MGNCSCSISNTELQQSKDIDREIRKTQKVDNSKLKILFLGAGESGKSTLFRQMNILYKDSETVFTNEIAIKYKNTIHKMIIQDLRKLVAYGVSRQSYGAQTDALFYSFLELTDSILSKGMNSSTPSSDESTTRKASETTAALHSKAFNIDDEDAIFDDNITIIEISGQLKHSIEAIWSNKIIESLWKIRGYLQIQDSLRYYCDDINRIAAPDYTPTFQDILRARVRTEGIRREIYEIGSGVFEMYDVGGQRTERRKWMHCFDTVTAVVFVASLSEYDQVLREDSSVFRMDDALLLYDEIIKSRWFKKSSIILFLNKRDILQDKLLDVPFKVSTGTHRRYTDFEGPESMQAVTTYINSLFIARSKIDQKTSEERNVYTHITCATNTANMRHVFDSTRDFILRNNLRSSGLISASSAELPPLMSTKPKTVRGDSTDLKVRRTSKSLYLNASRDILNTYHPAIQSLLLDSGRTDLNTDTYNSKVFRTDFIAKRKMPHIDDVSFRSLLNDYVFEFQSEITIEGSSGKNKVTKHLSDSACDSKLSNNGVSPENELPGDASIDESVENKMSEHPVLEHSNGKNSSSRSTGMLCNDEDGGELLFNPMYSTSFSVDPLSKRHHFHAVLRVEPNMKLISKLPPKRVNVVFCIDVSQNMEASFQYDKCANCSKLESTQRMATHVLNHLLDHKTDRFGLVVYNESKTIVLHKLLQISDIDNTDLICNSLENIKQEIDDLVAMEANSDLDTSSTRSKFRRKYSLPASSSSHSHSEKRDDNLPTTPVSNDIKASIAAEAIKSCFDLFGSISTKNKQLQLYENRIIHITSSDIDQIEMKHELGMFVKAIEQAERHNVFISHVSLEKKFHDIFINIISSTKGSNYIDISSQTAYYHLFQEEFRNIFFPIVFDLKAKIIGDHNNHLEVTKEINRCRVTSVFGSANKEYVLLDAKTLFNKFESNENSLLGFQANKHLSQNAVTLIKFEPMFPITNLKKMKTLKEPPKLRIAITYTLYDGTYHSNIININFDQHYNKVERYLENYSSNYKIAPKETSNENGIFSYDNIALRKIVLLSRYVECLRSWMTDSTNANYDEFLFLGYNKCIDDDDTALTANDLNVIVSGTSEIDDLLLSGPYEKGKVDLGDEYAKLDDEEDNKVYLRPLQLFDFDLQFRLKDYPDDEITPLLNQTWRRIFTLFKAHFQNEMKHIKDSSLYREIRVLEALTATTRSSLKRSGSRLVFKNDFSTRSNYCAVCFKFHGVNNEKLACLECGHYVCASKCESKHERCIYSTKR